MIISSIIVIGEFLLSHSSNMKYYNNEGLGG